MRAARLFPFLLIAAALSGCGPNPYMYPLGSNGFGSDPDFGPGTTISDPRAPPNANNIIGVGDSTQPRLRPLSPAAPW